LVSQITLLPLEYGVLTNVVNLDKFNLFLLGLSFCGTKVICYLLLGLLHIHDIGSSLASALISVLLKSRRQRIKKPPDKSIIHDTALIACSSATSSKRHFIDMFEESFDHEETALVGLDSLCSHHLFNSKSDFVSKIEPIEPFSIQGVGGNIKAIGVGCVRICFRDVDSVLHDKILKNVYYAPKSPVRLISIPQLARDTKEASHLCTGGKKSVFTWDGISVTIHHHSPMDVPFLEAYLGNPSFNALYSVVQLLHVGFSALTDGQVPITAQVAATSESESDNPIPVDLNQDISNHILHMKSLLCAPRENSRQKEYLSWHNRLGHMSHTRLQELMMQGFLPKYFSQCTLPVCPSCLFAKQTKRPWHYKGQQGKSL
jgi:hypothetical protein